MKTLLRRALPLAFILLVPTASTTALQTADCCITGGSPVAVRLP
ncbi:hypothetical protein [Deinococcus arboris]|nr:hypothetical protein [Deinococcus arboris]